MYNVRNMESLVVSRKDRAHVNQWDKIEMESFTTSIRQFPDIVEATERREVLYAISSDKVHKTVGL